MKIQIPETEKKLNELKLTEITIDNDEINLDIPNELNAITLYSLSPAQLQILQKVRLKLMMLKELEKIKLIPVLIRNSENEEKKLIIRLQ